MTHILAETVGAEPGALRTPTGGRLATFAVAIGLGLTLVGCSDASDGSPAPTTTDEVAETTAPEEGESTTTVEGSPADPEESTSTTSEGDDSGEPESEEPQGPSDVPVWTWVGAAVLVVLALVWTVTQDRSKPDSPDPDSGADG